MTKHNEVGSRKLYKNPDQAKVCGVCAGMAEYFGFEVWVVRIIAITMLLLSNFIGIIPVAYFVLCFVLEPKPGSKSNKGCFGRDKKSNNSQINAEANPRPYRSSVKDVWSSGASPKETLEEIEGKFGKIEVKLQSIETFVTSSQYELETKFRAMDC
jgi:phage shock protein C